MDLLTKLQRGIDREPSGGEVLARVQRLEMLIEKMSDNTIADLEKKFLRAEPVPLAPPAPASSPVAPITPTPPSP